MKNLIYLFTSTLHAWKFKSRMVLDVKTAIEEINQHDMQKDTKSKA